MGGSIQVTVMAAALVAFALLAGVLSARTDETVGILLPSKAGAVKADCCNTCVCPKIMPPCQCWDLNDVGCHKDCQNCVQMTGDLPKFACMDWKLDCTPCGKK